MLRALRLLRMRWLRPSYSSLDDMIGLARDLARWNEPVLNLLFHSSEAIVGGSPYNQDARRSSTRSATGSTASSRSPTRELGAVPATFAEFRAAYAPRALMRILHVTPHLPPDQAANALLPWQLGNWAHAGGEEIEYVAHPPRAGGTRPLAGPVTWVPRSSGGPSLRAPQDLRPRWRRTGCGRR